MMDVSGSDLSRVKRHEYKDSNTTVIDSWVEMLIMQENATDTPDAVLKYLEGNEVRGLENDIAVFMGILSVIFNGISLQIFGFRKKILRQNTRMIILHQCSIDMCAGGALIFSQYHSFYFSTYLPRGIANPELYCKIFWSTFFLWSWMCASAMNIQLMTIERYASVCHPFKHRDYFTRRGILVMFTIAWTIALVFIAQQYLYMVYHESSNQCLYQPPNKTARTMYAISYPTLFYVMPLAITLYTYGRMFRVMRNRVAMVTVGDDGGAGSGKEMSEKEQKRTRSFIITCCFVSSAYIICFTGSILIWTITSLELAVLHPTSALYQFTVLMVFTNCFINPLIFVIKMPAFRRELKSLLLCRFRLHPSGGAPGGDGTTAWAPEGPATAAAAAASIAYNATEGAPAGEIAVTIRPA